jgi:hypothetical protein
MKTKSLGIWIFIFLGSGLLARFRILPANKYKIKIQNTLSRAYYIMLYIFCGYVMFIESNPRHPPRAFPLGLRVPRFDERASE